MTKRAQRSGRYFQFPLCALAFGKNAVERLNALIDYGVVQAGNTLWAALPVEARRQYLDQLAAAKAQPRGFSIQNGDHVAALYGAKTIGVSYTCMAPVFKRFEMLRVFQREFEAKHGADPLVRLRRDLVFDARDGRGLTYREFAVLAAIFSVIGVKTKPVRITQKQIRHRVLGYKTDWVMQAEVSKRLDGAWPLSDWMLRDTIDQLHARKFFARATHGRRVTYYSHRLPGDQLRRLIRDRKLYPTLFRANQRLDDQTMTDEIRNSKAIMEGKPPPRPDQTRVLPPDSLPPLEDGPEL